MTLVVDHRLRTWARACIGCCNNMARVSFSNGKNGERQAKNLVFSRFSCVFSFVFLKTMICIFLPVSHAPVAGVLRALLTLHVTSHVPVSAHVSSLEPAPVSVSVSATFLSAQCRHWLAAVSAVSETHVPPSAVSSALSSATSMLHALFPPVPGPVVALTHVSKHVSDGSEDSVKGRGACAALMALLDVAQHVRSGPQRVGP